MISSLKNRKTWLGMAAMALTIAATGCNGGGGGGGGTYTGGGGGGPYLQSWYDVYGNLCGSGAPRAGCNFYGDGTKIKDYQDPNYAARTLEYAVWQYTDSYGYAQQYTGYAWLSTTGILYDDLGHALNETGDDDSGRDLISVVADQENDMVQAAGKDFAARYALAEDTGVAIAKTLNDWALLGKERARTEKDVADVAQRLYGVNIDTAVAAIDSAKKGDASGLLQVNGQIAAYWGTTPETSSSILKKWYAAELKDAGAM